MSRHDASPWTHADIPGYCEQDLFDLYADMVKHAPSGAVFVEVGVLFGKSLAFLAQECRNQTRGDITIYGVDPWIEEDWMRRDHGELIDEHGSFFNAALDFLSPWLSRINILRCTSYQASLMIRDPHFVFLDGDHEYDSVYRDIADWTLHDTVPTFIGGHDFGSSHPGVEKAVREYYEGRFDVRGSCWVRK